MSATYWDRIPAPIGIVYVAVNEDGALVGLSWGHAAQSMIEKASRDPARLTDVRRQLREYFAGSRGVFTLQVDLGRRTPFQRRVIEAVQRIPYGEMWTYKDVAIRAGSPGAARAVGQVLAKNEIPIVIPCHRVVAADGQLRGFSATGGIATKEALLRHEGAL